MQALIEELAALVQKIKTGEATLGELEAFVSATGQLHERAVILRYKAYEANVFGSASGKSEEEIVEDSTTPVMEEPEILEEEPIAESEEPEFDLFSLDEQPPADVEEEPAFELSMEQEEVEEAEIPVMESMTPEQETMISEDTSTEEQPETEPMVQPESKPVSIPSGELHGIYAKLNANDGSLAARLMTVRLETLKGAFGFNERLQIIQELFNGSNEAFSGLIDRLEVIPSREDARMVVSQTARDYNWDEESQLALELIQKVERKYA